MPAHPGMDTLPPGAWHRTREIFEQALALPSAERRTFVRAACDGDESLQQRVLGLLDSHDRASEFLEAPMGLPSDDPVDPPRNLSGAQLGVYKLQSRLGAGGMGEVYRAQDTRLQRR